jgi:hypothetical protein
VPPPRLSRQGVKQNMTSVTQDRLNDKRRLDGRPFPRQTPLQYGLACADLYAERHHFGQDSDQSIKEFVSGVAHAAIQGFESKQQRSGT